MFASRDAAGWTFIGFEAEGLRAKARTTLQNAANSEGKTMIRVSVLAGMALVLLGPDFSYASLRSNYREKQMKSVACHAKIDGKNLKGASLKAEWKKCMVNPDNYS